MWKCYKEIPCMEILKQAKMSFLFPFFSKIREQEGRTDTAWLRVGWLIPVGEERRLEKGV
jgi:hypothetical protein